MTPSTFNGMKALIQMSITTSLMGGALLATQHCTSVGPGQRPVTKVPEYFDGKLFRHVPAAPFVFVQDLLMQDLIFAGSFRQASLTVYPGMGKLVVVLQIDDILTT